MTSNREIQEASLSEVLAARPVNVLQACLLQLFSAVMTGVTTVNGYDYYVEMGALLGQATGSFNQFIASRAMSVLVALLLAWLFYQGKNWARIVFVAFFVVNVVLMAWGISTAGTQMFASLNSLDLCINLLQLLISFVVSCLLWTRKSSAWFLEVKRLRAS